MFTTLSLFNTVRGIWVFEGRVKACFEGSVLLIIDPFKEFELFEEEDLVVSHVWIVIPFVLRVIRSE